MYISALLAYMSVYLVHPETGTVDSCGPLWGYGIESGSFARTTSELNH